MFLDDWRRIDKVDLEGHTDESFLLSEMKIRTMNALVLNALETNTRKNALAIT